ncbi:MAG: ArsR family transcriptional regulator [Solirubrobacterales bacterium]|nr:ArsR family transcriptional regulator [Solirubrobacterales bacterium]
MIVAAARRCGIGVRLGGLPLLAAMVLLAAPARGAPALALSPLNGTPDASPQTQVSFLGVPANEIAHVSVVGSRSGRHGGSLKSYVSASGASFLPTHPFTQGERVTASALVGPAGHAARVSTTFTIARLSGYRAAPPAKPRRLSRPGLVQSFVSQPRLQPPSVFVSIDSPQAAPGDVFLTPSHGYGQSGAMILNGQGGLVWFEPAPSGNIDEDLQVQSYAGRPVLVWWRGQVLASLGIGVGTDEVYSSAYTPLATVSAGNGYRADLHEMQITPQGSALITAYSLVDADLSSAGGSRDGVLQDAILQEVDIRTGLVMFEWHAYGHVALSDSYSTPPRSAGQPWDYFHINSISLDPSGDGDFIVSSRNTWAGYEIDHLTGAVLWRLGGKRSSFKMGAGTGFAWQHDIRWQPDGTLTIFDDGATPKEHSESRAIRERIDWKRRAVALIGRDVHTPALLAGSQGDDQVLPDSNSFVGWGEEPYFSEFNPDGQMLFDAHIPSPGQSYRAYRYPWSATPAAPPAVAVTASGAEAATVYASWNGATGVSAWRVLGGPTAATLSTIATVPSTGFETATPVTGADAYFAVQALGAGAQVLGTSAAVGR